VQEGLPFVLPHLTRQVIKLGTDDFLRLLMEKSLPLPAAANPGGVAPSNAADGQLHGRPASKQAWLDTPAVLQQLQDVAPGGAVVVLEEDAAKQLGLATSEASGALTANAPLAIAVWRTPASLSVLVAKLECEQLAEKLKGLLAKQQEAGGSSAPPPPPQQQQQASVAPA
jgi:hypothetical protein